MLSVFLFYLLIALLAFINILGYFLSLHLVIRYDFQNKYPKFKKLINYYKKSSMLYIGFEILICITCLFILILGSILFVLQGIK